ncbi:hypothetical protein FOQG_02129 [Fusarium oxysporum f. sp. raphani 54005]|uniref:Uncharacterized protein n=3 Tax=Fusarium oxysporum TaxID=5507 RepID=X0CZJ8_FUSOX|nr:hypothetical protein FOVG_07176 [Fusarium oxysporum f. sp. pisi HDV247]EXK96698.1 hypothetical protein FOQG_02129 [Fusarium oxysporum f. sp. raphani 54005]KAG7433773.1 hypothetical protein Forpi1262_v003891 [Fusarium oxysporum f. sp. raphani]KAJ4038363.1 hypothetical protein NW758_009017 [Fusarium oxysporum]WKT40480.1 hypothetical protein QSH57_005286 [Fusarium oxysporum f. sp. vasinfectum]
MADSQNNRESNTVVGKEQYEEARKNWLDTAKAAQQAKNEAKQKYNEADPGTPYVEWLLRQSPAFTRAYHAFGKAQAKFDEVYFEYDNAAAQAWIDAKDAEKKRLWNRDEDDTPFLIILPENIPPPRKTEEELWWEGTSKYE